MDCAAYNIFYLDCRITADFDGKIIQSDNQSSRALSPPRDLKATRTATKSIADLKGELEEIRSNIKELLQHFLQVRTYTSHKSCINDLHHLERISRDQKPTLVFAAAVFDVEELQKDHATDFDSVESLGRDLDGIALLKSLGIEMAQSNLSLIIPVAMLPSNISGAKLEQNAVLQCIDAGARDVFYGPFNPKQIQNLAVQAYRMRAEHLKQRAENLANRRWRRRSWLGDADRQPYAYLREKMVSDLMKCICDPQEDLRLPDSKPLPALKDGREAHLKEAIGSWAYSGHQYHEDELIHAASFMIEHALTAPGLKQWHMPRTKLHRFLIASRAAYNEFVDYHNFRHVIDVMQAIFYFLLQLGILPPYPSSPASPKAQSSLTSLITPFDALTLLITAIGHDVGHPGVNNAFLVALNAPLAQLYNDRSVLEAFHCAAYSQILRRYWRSAFQDRELRNLMINSILATDMGVHQKYMTDLGNLQDKIHHQSSVDGLNASQCEEYRFLLCALLIKCADISNVARPYSIAVRWADLLQVEFANQGVMEEEVGIPTTLFGGPPELGNIVKLGHSQNGFMNFFARPLFENVADILPGMQFAVDEMKLNQELWTDRIRQATENDTNTPRITRSFSKGLSPRSPALDSNQQIHPEGFPASSSSPDPIQALAKSQQADSGHLSDPPSYQPSPHLARTSDNSTSSRKGSVHSSPTAHNFSTPRRVSGVFSATHNVALESRAPTQTTESPNAHPSRVEVTEDTLSKLQFGNLGCTVTTITGGSGHHSKSASQSESARQKSSFLQGSNSRLSGALSTAAESAHNTTQHITSRLNGVVHHRTSSGAQTNNTNPSLNASTPYSPTETQATSVLTADSEEHLSHEPGHAGDIDMIAAPSPEASSIVEQPDAASLPVKAPVVAVAPDSQPSNKITARTKEVHTQKSTVTSTPRATTSHSQKAPHLPIPSTPQSSSPNNAPSNVSSSKSLSRRQSSKFNIANLWKRKRRISSAENGNVSSTASGERSSLEDSPPV